ncbi:MAG: hypothetical protein KA713_09295 [Chryseotalea sp. WA131a]|jgi:hypothetical protein|nr:MAG: hypothetical protein KA713_00845 [Chryseotalea sp. WA131a]UXE68742.1 MAG: hypothetical protein KA713_09295 [Chryseotalea sp. WA131a]
MKNQLVKGFVDFIYGTSRVKEKYQIDNPSETVVAADASKGIVTTDNQDVRRGIDWVNSQRAVIIMTTEKIVCGKWTIPIDNISTAQLVKINSLFGGGQVLKIRTLDNTNYQFGMQLNDDWSVQRVLPLTIENAQTKYSTFSIIMRLFAIGCVLYGLYLMLTED